LLPEVAPLLHPTQATPTTTPELTSRRLSPSTQQADQVSQETAAQSQVQRPAQNTLSKDSQPLVHQRGQFPKELAVLITSSLVVEPGVVLATPAVEVLAALGQALLLPVVEHHLNPP
jgi:hypothetical protein